MNDDKRKKWIEAAKVLGVAPTKKVNCPECDQGPLEVFDVENQLNPVEFERYMICPKCKGRNILRMTHK